MKRVFSKHVFMRASVMMLLTLLTSMTAWATTENLGGYDFTVGTDTDGDYYVIDGTAALDALASYVNAGNGCSGKWFKMTADIAYDKTVVNNYTPIGVSHWFSGTFDGQGHIISGINIDTFSSSSQYAPHQAIFGLVAGTVKNLVVNNCSFFGFQDLGAIAGTLNGTIENCHVGNDVTLNGHSYVGGIAGSHSSGTIKGCTCAATITGRSSSGWGAHRLGGITGLTSANSKLTDNIFTGIISNLLHQYIGAIVGENQSGTLTNNVYTFTVLRGVGAADSATGTDESGASLARSITAGTNLTLDFAGSATTEYSPNGISVYDAAGMKYANTLYVGSTATVSLLLSYSSTPLTGYLATTGTLSGSAVTGTNDAYTLTMAGTDAVIYADGSLSYYVHFNANGGTGTMDNEAFFSDPKPLTANVYTRTGYTFAGWATTENGDVAYTDRQSVSNLTTTAGATVELYAKWTPIQYILFFAKNANGVQGDDSDRQRIYYDEDQNLHLCPYTRTGYTFAGWATTANGDVVYTDGQSVRNVSTIPGSIKVTPLYAKWTENIATLDEGATPLAELTAMSGKQTKVSFERTGLTAGKYSTICLPYDFTASETCTFYTFKGVTQDTQNNWVADIEETTAALTANTPYIFTTETATSVTFSNDAVVAAASYSDAAANTSVTDWTFQGTYSQIALPKDGEYDYGFAAGDGSTVAIGTFVHLVSGASAAPFRAYLKYTGSDNNWAKTRGDGADALPSRITVRIVGADGQATAIGTLDMKTGEISTGDWYSLDGRKLSGKPSAKGLYINNGRKVVIK